MSRKQDLEQLIQDNYDLIARYENIIIESDRPEEIKRSERKIREYWGRINGYLNEYFVLCKRLGVLMPNDIAEIAASSPDVSLSAQSIMVDQPSASGADKGEAAITPVLFLTADPTEASRLRLGEEVREIQEKLQLAKLRDLFVLHQRMAVRPPDLIQALLDVQPHIVHFSGHATCSGALCFEDTLGKIHPIQPDALAAVFEQFADHVNCVILNACFSEAQAGAIADHIDYVVGMTTEIEDKAAIAFSIGFYQAIGAGLSVEKAYRLGCVQIRLQGIPAHLTPVLKRRNVSE